MLAFASAALGAEPNEPAESEWSVHWDDGLYYRFVQGFEVEPEYYVLSRIEQRVGLAGKVNVRVETDGAVYGGETEALGIGDDAEFRRIHVGTSGELFLVTHAWYSVTVEFLDSGVELGDTYLQWRDRPWVGAITVGNFSPPFGLEATTSSRDITFMEQAAPVDAFAPARTFGVQIGRPFAEERFTWALGAFAGSALGESDVGDASNALGRFAGRLTWLARSDPESSTFLHLGGSLGFVLSNGDARYQTRPQSHVAPRVVDTDDIDSNRAGSLGIELAWVRGPWSVQSELIRQALDAEDQGRIGFGGFYVYTSYFLTGESRPYDPTSGSFSRLVPLRPFSFDTDGWGALELGARWSRTDLNDEDIKGGFLGQLDAGLSWYLTRHFFTKLELGVAKVRGRRDIGDSQTFRYAQLRLGMSY